MRAARGAGRGEQDFLEEGVLKAESEEEARDPVEVAGPLGTPLGLAQRKRASPRGATLAKH